MDLGDLRKQRSLFLDAICSSADIALIAYRNLESTLRTLSSIMDRDAPLQSTVTTEALYHAWLLVDQLYRLHWLLGQVPGLKRKVYTEGAKFSASASAVKDLRHGIQHLHQEQIRNLVTNPAPVWGSLSWIRVTDWIRFRGRVYGMAPGHPESVGKPPLVNPFGRQVLRKADPALIDLSGFGTTVCLTDLVQQLSRATDQLTDLLKADGIPWRVGTISTCLRADFAANQSGIDQPGNPVASSFPPSSTTWNEHIT
jgi:hypothetical protein